MRTLLLARYVFDVLLLAAAGGLLYGKWSERS
jgi:hypothetical protein